MDVLGFGADCRWAAKRAPERNARFRRWPPSDGSDVVPIPPSVEERNAVGIGRLNEATLRNRLGTTAVKGLALHGGRMSEKKKTKKKERKKKEKEK